jgi:hypothetical protein
VKVEVEGIEYASQWDRDGVIELKAQEGKKTKEVRQRRCILSASAIETLRIKKRNPNQ